jgi:hypothetical protein
MVKSTRLGAGTKGVGGVYNRNMKSPSELWRAYRDRPYIEISPVLAFALLMVSAASIGSLMGSLIGRWW